MGDWTGGNVNLIGGRNSKNAQATRRRQRNINRALALWIKGWKPKEIAAELGCHTETARDYIRVGRRGLEGGGNCPTCGHRWRGPTAGGNSGGA